MPSTASAPLPPCPAPEWAEWFRFRVGGADGGGL